MEKEKKKRCDNKNNCQDTGCWGTQNERAQVSSTILNVSFFCVKLIEREFLLQSNE